MCGICGVGHLQPPHTGATPAAHLQAAALYCSVASVFTVKTTLCMWQICWLSMGSNEQLPKGTPGSQKDTLQGHAWMTQAQHRQGARWQSAAASILSFGRFFWQHTDGQSTTSVKQVGSWALGGPGSSNPVGLGAGHTTRRQTLPCGWGASCKVVLEGTERVYQGLQSGWPQSLKGNTAGGTHPEVTGCPLC